ncbi:MAG: aspartate-semialdehyde dehydrogenase [Bdellovibrionota bacterium]
MSVKVAIVGATGLVGQEAKRLAKELLAPFDAELVLFASTARTTGDGFKVHALESSGDLLNTCDYVLNAAGAEQALWVAERLGPKQVLVDNSSAFRMDAQVPLVVPEVNPEALKNIPKRIVANPNCTAAILCVALKPLQPFGLDRVIVSTYQAASGAGITGLQELESQLENWKNPPSTWSTEVFGEPLLLNVLSHNSKVRPESEAQGALYNDEEWKMVEETRKMLSQPDLWISATCARVPVRRAHTESVTVDLAQDVSLQTLRELFKKADGVSYVDVPEERKFPSPQRAQDQDLVLVGRLRKDASRPKTLHMFISGDQLRKGAASNALQIIRHHLQSQKGKG